MPSDKLFDRAMFKLAGLFLHVNRVTDETRSSYYDALADLTDEEMIRAARWAIKNLDRMPTPAALRRAVGRDLEPTAPPATPPGPPPLINGVPLPEYVRLAQEGEGPFVPPPPAIAAFAQAHEAAVAEIAQAMVVPPAIVSMTDAQLKARKRELLAKYREHEDANERRSDGPHETSEGRKRRGR